MKRIKVVLFTALLLLEITAPVYCQEWTQYLGPDRNGVSQQKNLLRSWPQNGPELLWTVKLGIGYGGAAVAGGKVYLLDRDDKTGDNLRCFDLTTGKELWNFSYPAPGTVRFPGSRSVPAIDGNRLYTCGHNGDLYCLDINTHKPLWHANIWKDFGGDDIPTWAITQCPLIYGNLVILASQTPATGVVAFDKLSGKVTWKTPSLGPVGYVSPSLVKAGDRVHVVMVTASAGRGPEASGGKVAGIDPSNGKILWEYTRFQCPIPVPSPVDAGEGRLLVTGGYNVGSVMLKITRKSDGTYAVTELYKNPDFGAHTQPPVLFNGHFYSQFSTNERRDGLACMSIDGQVKWKTMRTPLFDKGGIIAADGLLLATDGLNTLYLIQPDPAGFKPISKAELLRPDAATDPRFAAQNWAPMAIAEGKLLIRDQGRLLCLKITK